MSRSPNETAPNALNVIRKRVDSARSDIADATTKLGAFRDDPLVDGARKDLIDAANKLAMAMRKLDRALTPGDARRRPGAGGRPAAASDPPSGDRGRMPEGDRRCQGTVR